VQDPESNSYDSLNSLAHAATHDSQPSQQNSIRPTHPMESEVPKSLHTLSSDGATKQLASAVPSTSTDSEPIHDYSMFTLPTDSGYDTMRPPIQPADYAPYNLNNFTLEGGSGDKDLDSVLLQHSARQTYDLGPGSHPPPPAEALHCPICKKPVRARWELK
jgi:hypothetical protein